MSAHGQDLDTVRQVIQGGVAVITDIHANLPALEAAWGVPAAYAR